MQLLLSRASQARTSCRCFSCAKAAARSTTKAPPKRRIRANDIFTACYSSLIASAVIADAEVKRERRRQWDKAIEEAKAANTASKTRISEREVGQTTYSPLSAQSSSSFSDGASSTISWRPGNMFRIDHGAPLSTPMDEKLKSLDLQLKQALGQATTAERITATVEEEDSKPSTEQEEEIEEWADENSIPRIGFREPKRRLHVDKLEESTSRLVAELLGKISIISLTPASTLTAQSSRTRGILDAIDKLRSGFSQYPNFTWDCEETRKKNKAALHASLYKICQRATPEQSKVDMMLAKICYNLLISTSPPNIITYNILIGELDRLKLFHISEVVIDSFFCWTRLAPTMETVRLMLDHYAALGDRRGFQDMLDRMRCTAPMTRKPGERIGNMRVGARHLKLLHLHHIQQWALQHRVIHRNGELWRKCPRDANLFNSIIQGCLSMNAVRSAVRYLKAALREGQEIQGRWIYAVSEACADVLDHKGAHLLLNSIIECWRDQDGNALFNFSREVRLGIRRLLSLCGIDGTTLPTLRRFHHIREDHLHDLLLHMHIEDAKDKVMEYADYISKLHRTLGLGPIRSSNWTTFEVKRSTDRNRLSRNPRRAWTYSWNINIRPEEDKMRNQISYIEELLRRSRDRLLHNEQEILKITQPELSQAPPEGSSSEVCMPHPKPSNWRTTTYPQSYSHPTLREPFLEDNVDDDVYLKHGAAFQIFRPVEIACTPGIGTDALGI